jgi:tripartite-type tricarboxylate transporter receptor subunit TctC
VTYASPGIGAGNHLAGELFASTLGVNVRHIPYKGSAPANTDLLAGRVTMMFQNMVSGLPLITSGRMRTRRRLASTSRLRMACC